MSMTDSELIWKFLVRNYPDDHQAIYLYCCGQERSAHTAIKKIQEFTNVIFGDVIQKELVYVTIKGFLDYKKKEYKKGNVTVKSIY